MKRSLKTLTAVLLTLPLLAQAGPQGTNSGGGGNFVGTTLFDFYENQGTTETDIDTLIARFPQITQILERLDDEVPYVNGLSSRPFGTAIKKALARRTIYLEPKEITAVDCINSSTAGTKDQKVAACQTNDEVRFHTGWLNRKDVTVENHMGLIVHEMVLAFANDYDNRLEKAELEDHVRKLNREIFFPTKKQALSKTIKQLFNVETLNHDDIAEFRKIKLNAGSAILNFCRNKDFDIVEALRPYETTNINKVTNAQRLYSLMEDSYNSYSLIQSKLFGKETSSEYEMACVLAVIKYSPITKPDLSKVRNECQEQIKDQLNEENERLKRVPIADLDLYLMASSTPRNMSLCGWGTESMIATGNYYKYLAREAILNK